MYGVMSVGAVDCKEDEEVCEDFSIYDTAAKLEIKIFTENFHDDGVLYNGKKDWKSIAGAASKKMQSFVNVVN